MNQCTAWMAGLLLAGCATARTGGAASGDSAREGVDAFNRALAAATRIMDDAAVIALWEEDGVSVLPGSAPVVGRARIGALIGDFAKAHPGARMKSFEMTCDRIEIAGDLAHEICAEHQVVELDASKPPFDGRGQMLFVLHRGADGAWRLRREMWTQGEAR